MIKSPFLLPLPLAHFSPSFTREREKRGEGVILFFTIRITMVLITLFFFLIFLFFYFFIEFAGSWTEFCRKYSGKHGRPNSEPKKYYFGCDIHRTLFRWWRRNWYPFLLTFLIAKYKKQPHQILLPSFALLPLPSSSSSLSSFILHFIYFIYLS
jgi:hypothetical protein